MSEFDRLKIQVKDQVALVTIDQPEVLNCLNEAMLDELERRNLKRALITMCVGGGMGIASIIERL